MLVLLILAVMVLPGIVFLIYFFVKSRCSGDHLLSEFYAAGRLINPNYPELGDSQDATADAHSSSSFDLSDKGLRLIRYFWRPTKTCPISSACPKSVRASATSAVSNCRSQILFAS